jgi:hypothetical protein
MNGQRKKSVTKIILPFPETSNKKMFFGTVEHLAYQRKKDNWKISYELILQSKVER